MPDNNNDAAWDLPLKAGHLPNQGNAMNLPPAPRVYQCHHFDSTRWNYYRPRPDDIIIATSYKAGTTWTQAIVANLLFPDGEFPAPVSMLSPWLDINEGFESKLILAKLNQLAIEL